MFASWIHTKKNRGKRMTESTPQEAQSQASTETAASTQGPAAPVAPENVPEQSSTATESGTFSERAEVGDIVVDDHNRPVLVLDVNDNEGGAVTGVAFNLDGTTEVVTERPDDAAK